MSVEIVKVTYRVPEFVREDLARLKRGLALEEHVKASQDDIVAAMIHGVTASQVAGMMAALVRHWAALDAAAEAEKADASE